MKCSNCGNENSINSKFCIYCGSELNYNNSNVNNNTNLSNNNQQPESMQVIKEKPNYANIVFKSIAISIGISIAIFIIPAMLFILLGMFTKIPDSVYPIKSFIQYMGSILMLFIGTPVIIVVNCARAGKK